VRLLTQKVALNTEGINRLYLGPYRSMPHRGGRVAPFFRAHCDAKAASTALMGPFSRAGVSSISDFTRRKGVQLLSFAKGSRTDEIRKPFLQGVCPAEGVLCIVKALAKLV
jgi:hypothetical protein